MKSRPSESESMRFAGPDRNADGQHRQRIAKSIPLGRMGQQEDIGKTVVFLASDAASYITGAKLEGKPGEYLVCQDMAPAPLAAFFSTGVPPKEMGELNPSDYWK